MTVGFNSAADFDRSGIYDTFCCYIFVPEDWDYLAPLALAAVAVS
jgi:hypothetical protein